MIEKIKEKIDKNRNDKEVFKEYINAFMTCEKARELFQDDEDFTSINVEKIETKKEEDEFF